MYINPELYNLENEQNVEFGGKKNAIFEQQSRMGHATGKLVSPQFVRNAIARFYEDEQKPINDVEYVVVNDNLDPINSPHSAKVAEDDDGTLG